MSVQSAAQTTFGPDGARSIYVIPERNRMKFEIQMEELSKRSIKLGFAPIKPILIGHHEIKDSNRVVQRDATGRPFYNLEYYLTAEMPVIEGWTFVARIDHANETGNIVRTVPNTGVELPIHFRTAAPSCDHCKINRKRRDTYVLHCNETGDFKQVGSTCLIDFFGHDPLKIAKLAEVLGYADELGRAARSDEFFMTDRRWIDVAEFVMWSATAIRKYGWVSSNVAFASQGDLITTRERTFALMFPKVKSDTYRADNMTPDDEALGTAALQWARELAGNNLSNYEHNISVIANAVVMEDRSASFAASIVSAYHRAQKALTAVTEVRANLKTDVGNFAPVIALMKGDENKVRFSKLHLQLDDGTPVVLAIAGSGANQPGTVNVTNGAAFGAPDNVWFGRVTPEGKYEPNKRTYAATASAVAALLSRLADDPIKVAVEFGKLTNRCFACNLPLSDAKSAHMGYGPTCAKKLGWFYPTPKQFKGMIAEEVA